MTFPLFELKRFNGVEAYAIEAANFNCYQRAGMTEVVFVITTSECIAALPDTKELSATPTLEIAFRTNVSLLEVFSAGAKYSGIPEYDDALDEWMGGINNQVQHPTGKVPPWESTTNNSLLKNERRS